MLLSKQLDIEKSRQNRRLPFFINRYFKREMGRVGDAGYMARAFKTGDIVPDGEFLNRHNELVKLSDLKNELPAIISFYRGSWCPYCNLELRNYNQLIQESKMGHINMFAISPEAPDSAIDVDELNFTVLSDIKNTFAKKLNLVFKPSLLLRIIYRLGGIDIKKTQNNPESELPMPATYVIDGNGIITYAFVDADYMKRAEPSLVLSEYQKLISE